MAVLRVTATIDLTDIGSVAKTIEQALARARDPAFDHKQFDKATDASLRDVAAWLTDRVRGRIPSKTGRTRKQIAFRFRKTIRKGRVVTIYGRTPRAKRVLGYLEFGTPARIYPTTKKALKFKIGNKTLIRRSVKGQKAQKPLRRAMDEDARGAQSRMLRGMALRLSVE